MTGSFGGQDQDPEKRGRFRQGESNPFRQVVARNNTEKPLPPRTAVPNLPSAESRDLTSVQGTEAVISAPISPGVRLVAFGIDFILAYVIAALTTLIPFINRLIDLQTVMAVVFLTRDYFFVGHGFGKNLMGLKVIDVASGKAPTILQSTLRNIILIAPFVAFQIIVTILKFAPLPWLDTAVIQLLRLICTIYIVLVLPLEGYRILTRQDGLRKGDELAGTQIVEAPMDFSHFLSPPKG